MIFCNCSDYHDIMVNIWRITQLLINKELKLSVNIS